MKTKIVAVSYPTGTSRMLNKPNYTVIHNEDDSKLKGVITQMLFEYGYNYLLITYNDTMYVIDPLDINNKTYSKRVVTYHPLSDVS